VTKYLRFKTKMETFREITPHAANLGNEAINSLFAYRAFAVNRGDSQPVPKSDKAKYQLAMIKLSRSVALPLSLKKVHQ